MIGKLRKVQPMGLDLRRRWKRALNARYCRVHHAAASRPCSRSSRRTDSISAEPRLVIERTVSSPGTLFTACSMGRVMVTSICSIGMTPLSTPMITRGKFVVGKTATGSWNAS